MHGVHKQVNHMTYNSIRVMKLWRMKSNLTQWRQNNKAFDSVPHKRLLGKLVNFWSGLTIFLLIGDNKWYWMVSSHTTLFLVVFHRDLFLGPLLFTMFINDLPSVVSSPILMFADDVKIFWIIRSPEDYIYSLAERFGCSLCVVKYMATTIQYSEM